MICHSVNLLFCVSVILLVGDGLHAFQPGAAWAGHLRRRSDTVGVCTIHASDAKASQLASPRNPTCRYKSRTHPTREHREDPQISSHLNILLREKNPIFHRQVCCRRYHRTKQSPGTQVVSEGASCRRVDVRLGVSETLGSIFDITKIVQRRFGQSLQLNWTTVWVRYWNPGVMKSSPAAWTCHRPRRNRAAAWSERLLDRAGHPALLATPWCTSHWCCSSGVHGRLRGWGFLRLATTWATGSGWLVAS